MLNANEIITRDAEVLSGTPVFRGTRVPFQTLLDYLEGGETLDEFLDDFSYGDSRSRHLGVGECKVAAR